MVNSLLICCFLASLVAFGTCDPSALPTVHITPAPTPTPTVHITPAPTPTPSHPPSVAPTAHLTPHPSTIPSPLPSSKPTVHPSLHPTLKPTGQPTAQPSHQPGSMPTARPSRQPHAAPTSQPSASPSGRPSKSPTRQPSAQPTRTPTGQPSAMPSSSPTTPTSMPSRNPTTQPSSQPTAIPTQTPSTQPSSRPTTAPTDKACPAGNYRRKWIGKSYPCLPCQPGTYIPPGQVNPTACTECPLGKDSYINATACYDILSTPFNASFETIGGQTRSYTVPVGVTLLFVRLWGAGGGGGTMAITRDRDQRRLDADQRSSTPYPFSGGSGGYTEAYLSVKAGQVLIVTVGGGGACAANDTGTSGEMQTLGGFGGGGNGLAFTDLSGAAAGGGGGRSAIGTSSKEEGYREIITAGGGGGGGGGASENCTSVCANHELVQSSQAPNFKITACGGAGGGSYGLPTALYFTNDGTSYPIGPGGTQERPEYSPSFTPWEKTCLVAGAGGPYSGGVSNSTQFSCLGSNYYFGGGGGGGGFWGGASGSGFPPRYSAAGLIGGGSGGSGFLNASFLAPGEKSIMLTGHCSSLPGTGSSAMPPQWYNGRSLAPKMPFYRNKTLTIHFSNIGTGGQGSSSTVCGAQGVGGNGLIIIEALNDVNKPTMAPSGRPTGQPSASPSCHPSSKPSARPSPKPTTNPTPLPSSKPTTKPSPAPSTRPSKFPTGQPTRQPTSRPTRRPHSAPSSRPSKHPTPRPSGRPTTSPTPSPSNQPTPLPSPAPSPLPTAVPTVNTGSAGMSVSLLLFANTELFNSMPGGYDNTNPTNYKAAIIQALQATLQNPSANFVLQASDIKGFEMTPSIGSGKSSPTNYCPDKSAPSRYSSVRLCSGSSACNSLSISFYVDIIAAGLSYPILQSDMTQAVDGGNLVNKLHDFGCNSNATGLNQINQVQSLQVANLHPPPVYSSSFLQFLIKTSVAYIYFGTGAIAVLLGAVIYKTRTDLEKTVPMLCRTSLIDCLFHVVMAIMLACSNSLQVASNYANSDAKSVAVWCTILSIRSIVLVVGVYILVCMLFRQFLNKMLIPEALHQSALWSACAFTILLDPTLIRLLPWQRSEFSHRSGGYPNFFIFRLSLLASIFNSTGMTALSSVSCDLHNLKDFSNSAPFFLSVISLAFNSITFIFKLTAERLFELRPDVDTKEDIEFKAEELRKQEQLLQEITNTIASQKRILEAKKIEIQAQDRDWLLQEHERIRAALNIKEYSENPLRISLGSRTNSLSTTEVSPARRSASPSSRSIEMTDMLPVRTPGMTPSQQEADESDSVSMSNNSEDDDYDYQSRLTFAKLKNEFMHVLAHEDTETIDTARATIILDQMEENAIFQRNRDRQSEFRRSSFQAGQQAKGSMWGWKTVTRALGWGSAGSAVSTRRPTASGDDIEQTVVNPMSQGGSTNNIAIEESTAEVESPRLSLSRPRTSVLVDHIPEELPPTRL